MKTRLSLFVLGLCTFLSCQKENLPTSTSLASNWTFKNVKDTAWLPAQVPGEVHMDLLRNEKIEDPFIANNELDLQWISKEDWEYRSTFSVDQKTLQKKHIILDFKGLDTYATVELNGTEILQSDNAFREFSVDVKSLLKAENKIRIVFESTTKAEAIEKAKLPYWLPPGDRIFTRKPQFHYGWDWGPILTSSGVSKPIYLTAWDDLKIEDVYVKQPVLNDTLAKLKAEITLQSALKESFSIDVLVNEQLTTSVDVSAGETEVQISFEIQNPKKWWPHNIGDPYLYSIEFVVKQGNTTLDKYKLKKGLRTVRLVTEKDSIGKSFYFTVNDVPVYAKGANYIPQHSFQNQVTDQHYQRIIQDALGANMNMLRVWGGGIYEEDFFYDLCDEKGILVWQDFMFACAMYPGDDAFLENVKQEAIDNIKRLRNHSSIALWCGNNENNEGWHRWGWQNDRSEEERKEIWDNYLKLFDKLLPELVSEYTDGVDYWESSPKYGRGNPKYKTEGDAHDWWIWHDEYPFEHLLDAVPRFMSEFGFQAFPSYEAIQYINGNDSITVSSKAFDTHQKHPRGYNIIKNYMERDYPVPTKDDDYVYMSQVLQANGMALGFEAQRRARPYNMGTLYWQLNDCWPVISWSSIDFLGNWKAMHYKTKKAFDDVLVSSRAQNDTLRTYIVNDLLIEKTGTLTTKIIDFKGKELYSNSKEVTAKANTSQLQNELNLKPLNLNSKEVVIITTFIDKSNYYYLTKPKDLKLEQGTIEQKIVKTPHGFSIKLTSDVLQREVFLYTKAKGHFSDNFFDLLPNESKIIVIETEATSLVDLKIKTLNNIKTNVIPAKAGI